MTIDRAVRDGTIDARFAEVARAHADRDALRTRDATLTYRALDLRVDVLARALAAVVGDGDREARCALLAVSPEAVVTAIHAVLRAGHAFVPLDASHPRARLAEVVGDAEPRVLVTEPELEDLARAIAGDVPVLVTHPGDDRDPIASGPPAARSRGPSTPAAILYTSGSTGRPKGVVHTHASLLHSFVNYANGLALTPHDRLALTASPAFAATLSDLFGATLVGACLLGHPLARLGLAELPGFLARERATIWFMVPSVFRRVVHAMTGAEDLSALRVVKLAGEAVRPDDVALFRRRFPPTCRLLDSLGMTELNLVAQHFIAADDPVVGDLVPVGRVAPDVEVVVLDPDPTGAGELELRCDFLAAGYWRDPELTAARFGVAPDGRRTFRTGDRGRIEAGLLHHLGRVDAVVKVGGVRVDPGEVERALVAAGLARDAVVLPRPDRQGGLRLVAWVVPDPGPGALAEVRRRLGERLPTAMLPSALVGIASWPLGVNGKLDRQALPEPGRGSDAHEPAATEPDADRAGAPRDALQELALQALRRTLGRYALDLDDDFFAAGGDSLAAMTAALRLEQELGRPVPVAALLTGRTARALARALATDHVAPHFRTLVPLQVRGAEPPLFCVHPRPGHVASYIALAGHLAPDIPVYGLQAAGLDGREAPDATLAAMVDRYLAEVLRVAPRGPYRLVGWCVGGVVALELARRLVDRGHEVELVVLADSRLPVRGLTGLGAELAHALRAGRLASWARRRVDEARVGLRERLRAVTGAVPVHAGETLIAAHMDRLVRAYRPRPYPGRVLVLETTEAPPPARVRGPDWIEASAVEAVTFESRHDRLLAEPRVRDVAVLLRSRLGGRPVS